MNDTIQRIATQRDMPLPNPQTAHTFPVFMLSDNIRSLVREFNPRVNIVYIVELPEAWHLYIHDRIDKYTRLAIPHVNIT